MIYIAIPYSNVDKEESFRLSCAYAAKLMSQGITCFAPIAHSHPIALHGNLPGDWAFWEEFDRAILKGCTAIHVLKMEGWADSHGVNSEITIGQEYKLSIELIDLEETW